MKYLLIFLALLAPATAQAQVAELFEQKCAKCHSPQLEKPKGKFVVTPDSKDKERILNAVLSDEMPPNKPLSQNEKDIVSRWANPPAAAPPAKEPGLVERTVIFLGKFHILALHFPIALIIAVVYFELVWLWDVSYRTKEADAFIKSVVRLTALGAAVAAGLGWLHGISMGSPGLWIHGYLGTAAAVMCVFVDWRTQKSRDWLYYVLLAVATGLMVATAHFGASLVHGGRFLAW